MVSQAQLKSRITAALRDNTHAMHYNCNEQPSQATAKPVGGKACSSTKGGLLRYILNTNSIHKVSSLKFAYFQGRLSRHITPPSEKTRPESWPGDYMGKATPSGGCHHPTAATKCTEQPSPATANPVGGKACSSTKGGLLRYILNTYSIHKVSSLKFALPREAISLHNFQQNRQLCVKGFLFFFCCFCFLFVFFFFLFFTCQMTTTINIFGQQLKYTHVNHNVTI